MKREPNASFARIILGACPLLIALWTCFAAVTVRADDKSYPATSCRQVFGSGGTPGTRPNGSVANDSSGSAMTLICPIVRDNTQTSGSWTVDVRVDDRTDTAAISCTGLSRSTFSAAISSNTQQTAVNPQGFATLPIAVPSGSTDGYYAIRCTLPAVGSSGPSAVIAYVVRETGDDPTVTDQKSYTGTYAEILPSAVGTFPFIRYDNVGRARPINAAASDSWFFPLIRDSTQIWWDRARFRFTDSDADQVLDCAITNYNEDGTVAGQLSLGNQDFAPGQATVTMNQNPVNPPHSGPITMRCHDVASDTDASMYDLREHLLP